MDIIRENTLDYFLSKKFESIPDLPKIEKKTIRTKEEVCYRSIIQLEKKVLSIYPSDIGKTGDWLKEEKIFDFLSKTEIEVFNSAKLNKQDIINFSWGHESLNVLLWSLGHINTIDFPDSEFKITDKILDRLPPNIAIYEFISKSKMIHIDEILKLLDIYFHFHWFVRKTGRSVIKLNKSVIIERRKALEWIVDKNSNWDSIVMDT